MRRLRTNCARQTAVVTATNLTAGSAAADAHRERQRARARVGGTLTAEGVAEVEHLHTPGTRRRGLHFVPARLVR